MRALDQITGEIVNTAYRIHTDVGPGLLESVYEAVLAHRLQKAGLHVERQKRIPFEIDGIVFEESFRADLIVEGKVLVELKSAEKLAPIHVKQILTYLRLLHFPVGLLINFGAERMQDGIKRVVNGPAALQVSPAGTRGSASEVP
ncbi:MAG TPA: GxxExxY protein [Longimicrobium sp.]|jgi:iron complex transport system substrate-binding protein|uniref:GxxExxY protein n=1 Tax=Longimicrobium sp. TaxID=2029185 RepID=UPI002EDA93A9